MVIDDRDRRALAEVFLSRVARRDDLIVLGYFGSVSRCNARLLSFRRDGLLAMRTHLDGTELRCPLYICTAKGIRTAADQIDIPLDQALETHRSGIRELAIRHALRCTDLRIRIRQELGQRRDAELVQWSHELLCRHEFRTCSGHSILIKPDALCVIRWQGENRHVFLEVDLGNASLPKLKEKLARYTLYAESGAFADVYPAREFLVLTVTTDERRLKNIAGLSQRCEFAFTTWKRALAGDLLDLLLGNYLNPGGRGSR